ncbi:acylphosphatase [Candidatus Nitrosotenuis uzonensis]|uniref:acylphosphatase n=1 Tax=Candidatus Nitrosotenuis uzonensis TaxID=1407055 RepID=A0A812EW56_9ARCH|nr:acylphosphatase [Candidatus Nitrosotenuis uzonensis]CAE6486065.1 Acylphosphatase [Candidatus Nitrosotenuis uzonensis]
MSKAKMSEEKEGRAVLLVDGLVQGVGFRYMIRTEAKTCGLKGHIKNLEDGTVEIVCEGKKESIESLIDRIKHVRSPMRVDDIQVKYSTATGEFKTFKIISGDLGEEMIEGFSTGYMYLNRIDQKQDLMLEKQDLMLEKQDLMLEKQDQTIAAIQTVSEKQDLMLEKQDQTIAAIQTVSEKQDQMLEKQDQTIAAIQTVSEKQDQTIGEIRNVGGDIRGLSESMHSMLDTRFEKLESEIAKIKARLQI